MLEEKKVREKICSDFFPNCGICNFFLNCYPNNGLNDEFSELALLEQIIPNNNLKELKKKI